MTSTFARTNPIRAATVVPVLWDTKTNTIVNNESHEILRFLENAFDPLLSDEYRARNYYLDHLRDKIDEVCDWMQRDLNTGVYKAGFCSKPGGVR
ncbi:hypothetical protein GJ744_007082 [Endocarpon pusillum]|uniref:GST N-terminal domain-containing protein n=1 Tax=Endocarpon pusillum TaxID=364733 RepID=A0A8H7AJD4_9EURO|nr:hypothetical protein GJ744_007082 [Endocarpon pusillum]